MVGLRQWALFGVTIASTLMILPPVLSQASNPKLPLLPNERVIQFKNGCAAVMHLGQLDEIGISDSYWFGACRFGLAHGTGRVASNISNQSYDRLRSFHYGHISDKNYISRGNSIEFSYHIFDPEIEMRLLTLSNVADWKKSGSGGSLIWATFAYDRFRKSKNGVVSETYRNATIRELPCAAFGKMAIDHMAALDSHQIQSIKKYCNTVPVGSSFFVMYEAAAVPEKILEYIYTKPAVCLKFIVARCAEQAAQLQSPFINQAKELRPIIIDAKTQLKAELNARFAPLEAEAQ